MLTSRRPALVTINPSATSAIDRYTNDRYRGAMACRQC